MALLKYKAADGTWKDIYDHKLCRYLNLSELTDKQAARDNLEMDLYYLNRVTLLNGLEINVIHHSCIIQDSSARFVSDNQIAYWNAKIDPPHIASAEPTTNLVEGYIWYDASTDKKYIYINGKFREFDNHRQASGSSNFAGDNLEVAIVHGIVDSNSNPLIPTGYSVYPSANPQGYLGEVWVRATATHLYVGNTGTYKGQLKWTAFF